METIGYEHGLFFFFFLSLLFEQEAYNLKSQLVDHHSEI
jgi:hypothetical protein